MTLFPSDPTDQVNDYVRVQETRTGKGVFATRQYPATSVIGRITGKLIMDAHYGSEYSFELETGIQLEPQAPFRFVNHSCEPNCEFDLLHENDEEDVAPDHLSLIALRDIQIGEQLTIEYNWPASYAIRCECGAKRCRGWIVAVEELGNVIEPA